MKRRLAHRPAPPFAGSARPVVLSIRRLCCTPTGQSFGTVLLCRRCSWPEQRSEHFKTGSIMATYANDACNRNIEMAPLRKVQMAPSCYSGLQENGADDGGVDERQGVFATGRPARFGGGSYHDPGCG